MTSEREFDALLRSWLDASAPSDQPQGLLESVVTATAHTRPRPAWLARLGGEPMPQTGRGDLNRFAPLALAATAVVVALLIGIGLLVGRPNVGPSPIPGPSHTATAEPSVSAPPARAASWTATGTMIDTRMDFAATLLLDGRVLVTGGDRGYDAVPRALASAELYDPVSHTWTATGSMLSGRYRHTATVLRDGKVLVTGGNVSGSQQSGSGCCLATAELYDPANGTWAATGSMVAARVAHTATLLPDGKVLVEGGDSNSGTPSFGEVYDPSTGSWTSTSVEASASYNRAAILLGNGKVLVVGGNGGAGAELYDPGTGSWTEAGDTAGPPGTATLLRDGMVLFAGGDVTFPSAWLYNPASGTLAATGNMIEAHRGHTATLLPDGRVLVAGGDQGGNSVEIYDPATGSWTTTADMTHARFGAWATLLVDGRVLVLGGSNNTGVLASAELYDPGSGT